MFERETVFGFWLGLLIFFGLFGLSAFAFFINDTLGFKWACLFIASVCAAVFIVSFRMMVKTAEIGEEEEK